MQRLGLLLTVSAVVFVSWPASHARAAQGNAAFMSSATATNTAYGGTADKAVNEIGSSSDWWHSADNTVDPWWKTDLGAITPIDAITVRARDGFVARLQNSVVSVYESADATGTPVYSNVVKMLSGVDQRFVLPPRTYGRSVKVSYAGTLTMNLSEVYVYSENLARGKTATMSPYIGNGPATCVDGTRPQAYPNIAHSQQVANPWWQVDLGGLCSIDSVRFWNRQDACQYRLADYNLQVLAADGSTVLYDYASAHGGALLNPGNIMSSPWVITVDLHAEALQGRYVKLIRPLPAGADNVLQVSEVEVFGSGLIENELPSGIAATTATLNGFVYGTNTNTSVTVYWGETDEGTSWGDWARSRAIGVTGAGTGAVAAAIGELTLNTDYYYRFRASNSQGDGFASESGRFRTLPVGDGLVAWYDATTLALADGASVTSWRDSAPAGEYGLSQGSAGAQPTYYTNIFGGQPVVSFDGGDSLWAGNLQQGWPSNSTTVFFVTKADTTSSCEFYRQDPNPSGANRFLSHYAYGNGNTYFDFGDIGAGGRLYWGNNNVTALNVVSYWQQAGVGQRAFRNGIRLNLDMDTSTFSINGYKFLLGTAYKGDIAELLIYNRALTADECSRVGYYLSQKYGVETAYYDPDTAVPPSVAGLQLWLDSDSNPLGYADGAGTATWPDRSGNANDATQGNATLQPLFSTNVVGGRSAMVFDGADDYIDGPGWNLRAQTIMMVLKLDADVAASLPGAFARKGQDSWNIRGTSTAWNYTGIDANSADFAYNGTLTVDGVAMPTHHNAYHILTEVAAASGANQYRISQTQYSRYWKGGIAEVLAYDRALTTHEQSRLGYYLERKYGIDSAFGLVDCMPGASDIAASSATLNGNLCDSDGGVTTVVTVCWGVTDGGGAFGAWEHTNAVVTTTEAQVLAWPVSGLLGARTYYYRYCASNAVSGEVWADAPGVFRTDFQTAPGGVALWLSADVIPGVSDGEEVARWPDLSVSGRDPIQPASGSGPRLVTGELNGMPVVRNASGQTLYLSPTLSPMEKTMVIVHRQDAGQTAWTMAMGGDLHTTTSSGTFCLTRSSGQFQINSLVSSKQFAANYLQMLNGNYEFWINGTSIGTSANTANPLVAFNRVGNSFIGDIAEVILFDGTLDAAARAEIGNYLETRYGLDTTYVRVDNSGGATDVAQTSATANGHVYTADGGEATAVSVYWGTTDGGATAGAWAHTDTVATVTSPQDVSVTLNGLDPATIYFYRLAVSNVVSGLVFAESTVTFETMFGSATNGLVVWLDADYYRGLSDGASVGVWQDFSGNGNDATPGAGREPAYYAGQVGGRSVVRFDGYNDYMDGPNANIQAQTIFMVLKLETSPPSLSGPFCRKGYDQQNIRAASATTWRAPGNGADGNDFCWGGSVRVNGNATWVHNNQYHILEDVSGDAPSFQYRLSQTNFGTPGRHFKGDMAEVLIYNRVLTADERREVGRYLAGKYGLSAAYGKYGLPVAVSDPVIWYDIDSMMGLSDGETIGTLTDFSGNNNPAISQATAEYPVYATNAPDAFGGRPAVRFGGADDDWFAFTQRGDIRTVFWVVKEDIDAAASIRFLLGDDNQYHFHRGTDANKYIWGSSASGNVRGGRTLLDGTELDGLYTTMPTAPSIIAVRTTGNVEASRLMNDRSTSGRTWDGDLAELLVYNRALTDIEMAQVGYYLEEKYALTTDFDYVDNAGGATNVTASGAFLNGHLNVSNATPTVVKVFWGASDGGAVTGAWANAVTLGTVSAPQAFTHEVTGLAGLRTYYYRFYASNSVAGEVWANGTSAFSTGFQTPSAAVALWLSADALTGLAEDAPVEQWADLSGNGFNAVQGTGARQPVYTSAGLNGRPAVRFDGVDDFMDGPIRNLTAQTMFLVVRLDAASVTTAGVFSQKNADSKNIRNNGISGDWVWPATGNAADFCNGGTLTVNGVSTPTHGNQAHVLLDVASAPLSFQYRLCQPLILNGSHRNFKGELAELIAFSGALTDDERAEVGAYLETKYGLDTAYARVDNAGGATNIASASATLNGHVYFTDGGEPTVVKVFWGETDGGGAAGAWGHTTDVATVTSPQAVSESVGGLMSARTYYYRFYVSNAVSGQAWTDSAEVFRTHFVSAPDEVAIWLSADAIPGVGDGEAVGLWPDLGERGNDAVQATAGSRPQLVAGAVGDQPAVSFGGSQSVITDGLAAGWPSNVASVVLVEKVDSIPQGNAVLQAQPDDTANRFNMHVPWSDGNVYWDFGNIGGNAGRLQYVNDGGTAWNVWLFERSATGMRIIRNGVTKASKTGGSTLNPTGKSFAVGSSLTGDIAEVIVFNGVLDDAAQVELFNYMERRYGVDTPYVRVDNSGGATSLDCAAATVRGHVYYTDGGASTEVKVFWGTADGGAALGTWEHTNTVTTVTTPQDVSLALTGLDPATIYYYRMYVTNSVGGGAWAESAALFETRFSAVNDGLVLWLDAGSLGAPADGTPVASWQDLSGSGNDAAQGNASLQPLYYASAVGGRPVLRFDGGNDYMDGPTRSLTAQTVYMVLKVATSPPTLTGVFAQRGADQQNIRVSEDSSTWRSPGNGANGADFSYGGAVYVNGSLNPAHGYQYHILEEVSGDAPSFQYRISQTQYNRYFKGDLAEVIVYNRTLDKDERREVGRYLMAKYGLSAAYGKYDLPDGAQDPVIWYDVDSLANMSDGDPITTLFDFSGNNYNASSHATVNDPTYTTNGPASFGGKPTVRFNGADDNWFSFTRVSGIRTVFWVVSEAVGANEDGFLLGDDTEYNFHRGVGDGSIWYNNSHVANVYNGVTRVDGMRVEGRVTPMPKTAAVISVVTTGGVQADQLSRDRNINGRNWNGDLAELIVYNRALSDFEVSKVGYYLEAKYGLDTRFGLVDNANGATNVTRSSAYLCGNLNAAGEGTTAVNVFWGTTDGATNPGAWQHQAVVAAVDCATNLSYYVDSLDKGTVYYYRYQAVNAAGTVWAESSQRFAALFCSVTNGLTLWLNAETLDLASGNPVTEWKDQSGSGMDALQLYPNNEPQFVASVRNGQPFVRFDGSSDYLDGPGANLTAQTLYFVLRVDPTAVNLAGVFAQKGADNRNVRGSTTRWNAPDWSQCNSADFCYNGSVRVNGSATSYHNNEYHVLEETAPSAYAFQYRLSQTSNSRYFKGDLAEVIAYNRTLTASEKAEVTAYLANRYGIAVAVPKHELPSVANDPVLWVDADAIAGLGDGDPVSRWYNLTGSGNDFVKGGSGNPIYRINQLNGCPVVRFDGDINTYFAFNRVSDIRTVFWVLREDADATGVRFLLGDGDGAADAYHFHRDDSAGRYIWHATHAAAPVRNGITRINGRQVDGTRTPMPTRYSVLSLVTTGNVQANRFVKDRNIGLPSRSWKGDLAELIIYNRALTDDEEKAVGRYLQAKYDIGASVFLFR